MSTKCTLAYGTNFHFYDDWNPKGMYLDLDNLDDPSQPPEFEVAPNEITVMIPMEVLKAMLPVLKKLEEDGWETNGTRIANMTEEDWKESSRRLRSIVGIKDDETPETD